MALAAVKGISEERGGYIETRDGDVVTHNVGHLLRQKYPRDIDSRWGFTCEHLPIDPDDIPLEPEPNKAKQLAVIEDLFRRRRITRVVLAGDAGREGSLIGRETIAWIGYAGPLARMAVVSYEPDDIRAAIREISPDSAERDYRVYLEGLARQKFDYWLGMTASVISMVRLKPEGLGREPFSSGGVISPLTALIVDREEQIRCFKPREHYQVQAKLRQGVVLRHPASAVLPSGEDRRLYDRGLAERIARAAKDYDGPLKVVRSEERVGPPRLFDKAALVAKAGRAFGWSPNKVLEVAQSLYDHPNALISYPRTESCYLKTEQAESATAILEQLASTEPFGELLRPVLADGGVVIRRGSRYNSAKVGEHHAIIPTRKRANLSKLGDDEVDLYLLVAENFIANHLPDAIDDRTRLSFSVTVEGVSREFTASGRIEKSAGWRRVFQDLEQDEREGRRSTPGRAGHDEAEDARLPDLADGEPVTVASAAIQAAKTQPPPRYREADLEEVMQGLIDQFDDPRIKAMLANRDDPDKPKGLGTAATRGTAIAKIIEDMKYVRRLKKAGGPVAPTEKGYAHVLGWRETFPALVDPVTRARMEGDLARIGDAPSTAEAERRAGEFLGAARQMLGELVDASRDAVPFDLTRLGLENPTSAPSRDMVKAIESIARAKGIDLRDYPGWRDNASVARRFLDEHPPTKREERPPTEAQANLVRRLADERDDDAAQHLVSAASASAYIERCLGGRSRSAGENRSAGKGAGKGTEGCKARGRAERPGAKRR
jgi:DNA topoisomerase-3